MIPISVALILITAPAQEGGRVIFDGAFHLGNDPCPEWPEASVEPDHAREFTFDFTSATRGEATLAFTQRHVNNQWVLSVNEERIADLEKGDGRRAVHYVIPAGVLRKGKNTLAVRAPSVGDDITVGPVTLWEAPFRVVMGLGALSVRVTDKDTGKGVPARITLFAGSDDAPELPPIYFPQPALSTAARPGVVYTAHGTAAFELPVGTYTLRATRGMEWGMDEGRVTVRAEGVTQADLSIRREVDTTGYVAADTHIHTVTFSGHGDSTIEERQVTLAGEGVELAIATDHNHNIDYTPWQEAAGLEDAYTPVVGDELNNQLGHFNAFPLGKDDEIPDREILDWVKWIEEIRSHGARVVILNHPRWPNISDSPFHHQGLDRGTGERATGAAFTFDCVELVNSTWILDDPLFQCRDWFALLNRGEDILAVGSSDSHSVAVQVGQGRTYVASRTDVPSRIDVDEACDAFLEGRTSISFGIFTDIHVGRRFGMGDTVRVRDRRVPVRVRVAAPGWITPRRVLLFLNGAQVAEAPVPGTPGRPTDAWLEFQVTTPPHDAWLVAVVLGDGVQGPHWKTMKDHTKAITNPVWLDVDGRRGYESPRAIAERLMKFPSDGREGLDAAVTAQLESLDKK